MPAVAHAPTPDQIRRLPPIEQTRYAVHAAQPEPLAVVYVVPASHSARQQRQQRAQAKEQQHYERWQKFRRVLARMYPGDAERTALYHIIEFWECWLCGFDAYDDTVLKEHDKTVVNWWRSWHFETKMKVIIDSRRQGRDQKGRRKLLMDAIRRAQNVCPVEVACEYPKIPPPPLYTDERRAG